MAHVAAIEAGASVVGEARTVGRGDLGFLVEVALTRDRPGSHYRLGREIFGRPQRGAGGGRRLHGIATEAQELGAAGRGTAGDAWLAVGAEDVRTFGRRAFGVSGRADCGADRAADNGCGNGRGKEQGLVHVLHFEEVMHLSCQGSPKVKALAASSAATPRPRRRPAWYPVRAPETPPG